jgi:hypothetical protein
MMKKRMILFAVCLLLVHQCMAQKAKAGAYYFDGWTGTYPNHITKSLVDDYSNRKPKWGWITSNQKTIDKQIKAASNSGLSFFTFCWYFNPLTEFEPLNSALKFYKKSKNREALEYNLLIVNHEPHSIGPSDWEKLTTLWINEFNEKTYIKIDFGKPLIIFYSLKNLVDKFGGSIKLKAALDRFRIKAKATELPGVTIAVCVDVDVDQIELATKCGFDLVTGYNYHTAGFPQSYKKLMPVPIDSLQKGEIKVWNYISRSSAIKFIPIVTLNWDPRPWASTGNNYNSRPYYTGFSEKSVRTSIRGGLTWLDSNRSKTTAERIILIYAWNENGEGAYLTPTIKDLKLLRGLDELKH